MLSRYIYWHISFNEQLGGGFSLYILTYLLHWGIGWGFLAIYSYIFHPVSHWVGVLSLYTDITFNKPLGFVFFAIYSYISLPLSRCFDVSWYMYFNIGFIHHWVVVSPIYSYISPSFRFSYIFSHISYIPFLLYILTYLLLSATGWGFLATYSYISPSFRFSYIYLHISFFQPLGGGFSLYILTYLLQWFTGFGFLATYTYISLSVNRWVGVSRYIYLHIAFIQPMDRGFLDTYTYISLSVSRWDGLFSLYILTCIPHSVIEWKRYVSIYRRNPTRWLKEWDM